MCKSNPAASNPPRANPGHLLHDESRGPGIWQLIVPAPRTYANNKKHVSKHPVAISDGAQNRSRVSSSDALSFWSRWRAFIDHKRPIKAKEKHVLCFFSRSDSFRNLFYAVLLNWNSYVYYKWQLIILYIDRMDWGAGHLTIIVGTGGGAFANKNCPQDRAFEHFFQMPGVCLGGCSRLELTRTLCQYFKTTAKL